MVRSEQRAEMEIRRKKVWANLLAGLNYREIAEALDCSIGTVCNDVKEKLEELKEETIRDVEEWRTLEIARIDRIINGIWKRVVDGDLAAVDRFLKLAERKAKLLGLDQESLNLKVDLDVSKLSDDQLQSLIED